MRSNKIMRFSLQMEMVTVLEIQTNLTTAITKTISPNNRMIKTTKGLNIIQCVHQTVMEMVMMVVKVGNHSKTKRVLNHSMRRKERKNKPVALEWYLHRTRVKISRMNLTKAIKATSVSRQTRQPLLTEGREDIQKRMVMVIMVTIAKKAAVRIKMRKMTIKAKNPIKAYLGLKERNRVSLVCLTVPTHKNREIKRDNLKFSKKMLMTMRMMLQISQTQITVRLLTVA